MILSHEQVVLHPKYLSTYHRPILVFKIIQIYLHIVQNDTCDRESGPPKEVVETCLHKVCIAVISS